MGIENLNNRSRVRHTAFMQGVLASVGVTNNSGQPIKLITRLGSRRSADGVVFDIGNGKVAKCIFIGRGAVNSIDTIKEEYKMAKLMSDAGAGPKVYAMKEFTLTESLLNLKNRIGSVISNWPNNSGMKRLLKNYYKNMGLTNASEIVKKNGINRAFSFNLFQGWWTVRNKNYDRVKKGAVIIMENLHKGPGVKSATTLYDYVVKEKHPMPFKEVAAVLKKMHSIKIAHQDLHAGNIMVQTKTDGSIRVVIIDFGRARYPANKRTMNWNKQMVANFAGYAGVSLANIRAALPKSISSSGTPPPFPAAPARLTLSTSKIVPLPFKSALTPVSYGLMKAASGGYRIAGKRGPIKPTKLTLAQLRNYAKMKGVIVVPKATKAEILNLIYKYGKGGAVVAPKKATKPVASSYGFIFNKGSVRMRGKKGPKKVTLTVAQLKAYAAKKGINLMGAKLKKNILQRLAK